VNTKRNYLELFTSLCQRTCNAVESREMISQCLETLLQGLDCEGGSVFLVNPNSGEIDLFALGNDHSSLSNISIEKAEGLVGWVIEQKKSVLVNDVRTDPRFSSRLDQISNFSTRAILAVPMIHLGHCVGALEILNPRQGDFLPEDENFCQSVAHLLTVLVRNVSLFHQTQQLLDQLKELDNMKQSFITMASHELFTPLTKIKMQSQLMVDGLCGKLSPDLQQASQRILRATNQLSAIARDLTSMNLLATEEPKIQRHSDHINSVLLETIEEVSLLCKKRKLAFSTDFGANIPEMSFDRRLISILVRNLLMNAIRFTPDQGRISLATSLAGNDVKIEVSDTGIGIPPEHLETIFQPLFEVNDSTYHHSGTVEFMSGGLGLGLPISRSIVLAHKGRIWAKSEVNKGSTFIVRLPINPEVQEETKVNSGSRI
jgi:signal transduction histidine kinase